MCSSTKTSMSDKSTSIESSPKSPRPPAPKPYRFVFGPMRKRLILIFGGVVVFSFLLGYGPGSCIRMSSVATDDSPTVGGMAVKPIELQEARRLAIVQYCLSFGDKPRNNEEDMNLIDRTAWSHVAARRLAERLGMMTGTDELREEIERTFSKDGKYDPVEYERQKGLLAMNFGIGPADFESYIRSNLTVRKLLDVMSAACWIPPFEVHRYMSRYTDSFVLDYAHLPVQVADTDIKITLDDMLSFHEDNPSMFQEPEMRRVNYVAFPLSDYMDETSVTDKEARDLYDRNYEDYISIDTNNLESIIPFEDVRDEIRDEIRTDMARDMAERKAMDLVLAIPTDAVETTKAFDTTCAAYQLEPSLSPYFARYDDVLDIVDAHDFAEATFELIEGDAQRSFSDPVTCGDRVFVLSLDSILPTRTAAFESVSNRVQTLVLSKALAELRESRSQDIADTVKLAVKAGTNFADAVLPFGAEPFRTDPFSLFSPDTNMPQSQAFLTAVASRHAGEFAEPIIETNGVLVAFVAERKPGDLGLDPRYVVHLLKQERGSLVYQDWLAQELKEVDFAGENASRSSDDEPEPDATESEDDSLRSDDQSQVPVDTE